MNGPICKHCGETEPTRFWRHCKTATGYRPQCKACEKPRLQTDRRRQQCREAARRYYARHRKTPITMIKLGTARLRMMGHKPRVKLKAKVKTKPTIHGVSACGLTDHSQDDAMIARFIQEHGVTKL
jgi:hypothetical protein